MAAAVQTGSVARHVVTYSEWGYRAGFVITSLALTALSYYSLPYYALACATVCIRHYQIYSLVQDEKTSSNKTKHWVALVSFVASCIAVSMVVRSVPALKYGFYELKSFDWNWVVSYLPYFSQFAGKGISAVTTHYDLSSALLYLSIFPLIAGYGIPMAQALYTRGLELLKMGNFESMEFFKSKSEGYKNLVSLFLDKFAFACELVSPGCLNHFAFTPRIVVMTIPFCSKEVQRERYRVLLEMCEVYPPREARLLWETALHYLFIQQKKWDLLQTIVEQSQRMSPEMVAAFNGHPTFPEEVVGKIQEKRGEIEQTYQQKLRDFQERVMRLKRLLNQPQGSAEEEDEMNIAAAKLSRELDEQREQITIFDPERDITELKKCADELRTREALQKIEALRSRRRIRLGIAFDAEQDTWEYFLSLPSKPSEIARDSLLATPKFSEYKALLKLFKMQVPADEVLADTRDALNKALKASEIETMGAFVEKVLGGDASRLQDSAQTLRELETYLQDQRQLLYRKLAGKVIEKTNILSLVAARVTYLAVMILVALAPLLTFPKMVVGGVLLSLPYYASPSLQDVLFLSLSISPFSSVQETFKLALQRPLLGLIRGAHPALKHTYDTSSVTGKMRILGTELVHAYFIMAASIGGIEFGGIAAGASIGREIWGYFWPQNVRRQYFI